MLLIPPELQRILIQTKYWNLTNFLFFIWKFPNYYIKFFGPNQAILIIVQKILIWYFLTAPRYVKLKEVAAPKDLRVVFWVDDNPNNNLTQMQQLEASGEYIHLVHFYLVHFARQKHNYSYFQAQVAIANLLNRSISGDQSYN